MMDVIHNDRPTELVVMLRPHIVPVLTELTKYFDLSVYTVLTWIHPKHRMVFVNMPLKLSD